MAVLVEIAQSTLVHDSGSVLDLLFRLHGENGS